MNNKESLKSPENLPPVRLVDLLRSQYETALRISSIEDGRNVESGSGSYIRKVALPIQDDLERQTMRIILGVPYPSEEKFVAEVFAPIQGEKFEIPDYFYVRTHKDGITSELCLVDRSGVTDLHFNIDSIGEIDESQDLLAKISNLDRTEDMYNQLYKLGLVPSNE